MRSLGSRSVSDNAGESRVTVYLLYLPSFNGGPLSTMLSIGVFDNKQ